MSNASSLCKWWILFLVPLTLWAEDFPVPVKLQLVSEVSTLTPGEPFTVALVLEHAPHHHSYYKFPGIVGVPTSIDWSLPVGFVAGPLQWPTPEQVDMRGHGAYGYHGDTLLLAEITPPKELAETTSVRLAGKVGFMCCSQERCTPGFEEVEMTLVVGKEVVDDTTWKPRMEKTRAALPKPLAGWEASVEETKTHFKLSLSPPSDLDSHKLPKPEALYFFSWNGWTASDKLHLCVWQKDHFEFIMPKHPFPEEGSIRFQGVVRSETGWPGLPAENLGMWIDADLP